MQRLRHFFLTALLCLVPALTYSQTIAEKKAGAVRGGGDLNQEMQRFLIQVNKELREAQIELHKLYAQVNELFQHNANPETFQGLLNQINTIRDNILILENSWREMAIHSGQDEAYSLWHQPETTLGQLIIDYGSQNFVYLVPPEIGNLKLSVDSNLPIPRSAWGEMLEVILAQNGVGYKQLNPYLRQLYFLKDNRSGLQLITNKRHDLDLFPPDTRVCFVLTPEPSEVRRIWLFLDKFVNPNSTYLQMIGRDILIVGPIAEVQDLLKLYDFVSANRGDKDYRVFPMRRVDAEEMAKILSAIFDQFGDSPVAVIEGKESRPKGPPGSPQGPRPSHSGSSGRPHDLPDANGLRIIALSHIAQALFLVGTKEELKKAAQIIEQVENQVGEAREKVIFWYTTKHSDAEELAEVLQKIYALMIKTGTGFDRRRELERQQREYYERNRDQFRDAYLRDPQDLITRDTSRPLPYPPPPPGITPEKLAEALDLDWGRQLNFPNDLYPNNFYQQGGYVVNPLPVQPKGPKKPVVNRNRDNFIVDPKTGSIAMVVEADILPKIKELIVKLDVPKKMVQIEVLLFERKITKEDDFGLNLLKIGDCASNVNSTCATFNDPGILIRGIFDFFISRKKNHAFPAFDYKYRFLLSQDDIQINASPSVVTVNQTPATIAIVEEISINTGIYNVETAKGVTLQDAFTRAQYGINIDITPTIHMTEDQDSFEIGDEPNYVTLLTDITFDTIQPGTDPERPDVTRRHLTNEVRIPDGQTVIIGGLRRKIMDDARQVIPFIGEIPGIGKLFSMREISDSSTEMFLFLTPTIIADPLEDFEQIKCAEMHRRPGDIPEFLCCLNYARELEKNQLMAHTLTFLFGPEQSPCYSPSYIRHSRCSEFDGRIGGDCYECGR